MKFPGLLFASLLMGLASAATSAESEEPGTQAPGKQFSLVIRERKIVGENTVRVEQGDLVELIFATDEPASLHLHGYDIEFDISPRDQTRITFEAHATGRFPLTSHGFGEGTGHGHDALLYLEVYPD